MIVVKRIYEEAEDEDGYRVLIDRLWPRGISKDKVSLDVWLKEVSPSNELRKWFGHDPQKWNEFKRKYKTELKEKTQSLEHLKASEKEHGKVSLLYAAKDAAHNNALVLKEVLDGLPETTIH